METAAELPRLCPRPPQSRSGQSCSFLEAGPTLTSATQEENRSAAGQVLPTQLSLRRTTRESWEHKQGWARLGRFRKHVLLLTIIRGTQPTLETAAYPLAMMLQFGQKLKLDAQALIGAQLQDR